ncbi:hypothetical protein ACTMTJ_00755 [Phytohabitans sp. LJ34]|uniref:hypothetical protein n=1 Tax=Phytohabitans sp. LJ34 TaxID=3452217 RepID=UPI003F8964D5
MLRRILLPLLAILTVVPVTASPAQANTADSASVTVAAKGHLAPGMSDAAPPPPPDCTQPCWPKCRDQAFPCWEIRGYNFFTNEATENMETLCMGGRLQLRSGQYDWGAIWDSRGSKFTDYQNKYVGGGWYGMSVCVDPRGGQRYTWTVGLWPDNPDWQPWVKSWDWFVEDAGWYYWGVYLDPLF